MSEIFRPHLKLVHSSESHEEAAAMYRPVIAPTPEASTGDEPTPQRVLLSEGDYEEFNAMLRGQMRTNGFHTLGQEALKFAAGQEPEAGAIKNQIAGVIAGDRCKYKQIDVMKDAFYDSRLQIENSYIFFCGVGYRDNITRLADMAMYETSLDLAVLDSAIELPESSSPPESPTPTRPAS